MMPDPTFPQAIVARDLLKRFGDFTAVNKVSFSVATGECFGLLGPNGAGKTSIARMIFGFSPLSDGSLKVLGQDIGSCSRNIKARLGVVAQDDNLDPELTVKENLLVYAGYFRLPASVALDRTEEILDFMDLKEKSGAVVDELSGGMKRRLSIGRALINRPELLILDEPTTGLDPYARHIVWQRLRQLKEGGTTMLLTTHYLEEASQLCDRLIVLNHGSILEEGNPSDLITSHVGEFAMELGTEVEWHNLILNKSLPLRKTFQKIGDNLILYSDTEKLLTENIAELIAAEHIPVRYQRIRQTNLEDVFLKLTDESLSGAER